MISLLYRYDAYLNKSLMTNVLSVLLVGFSMVFLEAPYQHVVFNVGIFALSGALTNWLAIVMLFEKIPFLYGSGVIPQKFESFKSGIKAMVMPAIFYTRKHGSIHFTTGNKRYTVAIACRSDRVRIYI